MKKIYFLICASFMISTSQSFGQLDLNYQTPDPAIMELADAPSTPAVRINDDGDKIILLHRNKYKSIVELSEKELRLGGLRINPKTNISSREVFSTNISFQKVGEKTDQKIDGLPENGRYSNFSWSPDESYMAFTNTTQEGVQLWVLDVNKLTAKQVSDRLLNANLGRPFKWVGKNGKLIIKALPADKKPLIDAGTAIPSGPTVSVNDGKKAQNRTYQDLLKNKNDEFNFEQLTRSELYLVNIKGGEKMWKETAMFNSMLVSPDGQYILLNTIEKPFSYLVPYYRFPSTWEVYDQDGKLIKSIIDVPLTEDLPKGFMAVRKGKRNIRWRDDKPATLFWAEALDGGNPENEVAERDEVKQWDAPFTSTEQSMFKTKLRFAGVVWGDNNRAFAYDYWWNTRMLRTTLFNPSDASNAPKLINERNYQDRYNDPGSIITHKNEFNKEVAQFVGTKVYLNGDGYSDEGVKPFIDEMDINTLKTNRLWQADGKETLEGVSEAIDMKKGLILTSIESQNQYPNYYIRDIKSKKAPQQITFRNNPFKSLENVHKEVIQYKRADGLELSATLYLPAGYDMNKKEKLPMLMWAYPREFKDKSSAGQVTSSPNEFSYPWYGSPIFWVNRGYVVLDDAAFPIVGEGDKEPNDSFMEQLVANAKAAIDAVDELGYIDRNRVAVGGHSYGAFMTANLLTHSDLFAAGIARSGAYNRTLTPFGFQSEERSYWEAPEIYYNMSPFSHADKMKTPLLLVHGQADNNSGTYPMQSERYFNALKGLGATVRLVVLPKESHGYSARESILHMLWEQDQWLEKYVKNKK